MSGKMLASCLVQGPRVTCSASLRHAKVAQDSHLHLTTCPTIHISPSVKTAERQRYTVETS